MQGKLKRVVIKEELVELTGDFRKSLILNQFLYWSERMFDTDKYVIEETERALKNEVQVNIQESKGWVYKTAEELNEELMIGMSIPTMRKYIKQLVEEGYLLERRNPKYKWDKTMQYRVDMYKVQMDLYKLGYVLEGYKLLPNINIVENKEAPTLVEVEAIKNKNIKSNNSICNNNNNNTCNTKNKDEKNVSENNEAVEILKDEGFNLNRKQEKEAAELMKDIDRLKRCIDHFKTITTVMNYSYFKGIYANHIFKEANDVSKNNKSFNGDWVNDPDLDKRIEDSQFNKYGREIL